MPRRTSPAMSLLMAALTLLVFMASSGCGGTQQSDDAASRCESDKDCHGLGLFCLKGKCSQCTEDRQCPEGYRCDQERMCKPVPGFCSFDLPCPPPLKCRNNMCGVECYTDVDCGLDQSCRRNLCIANPRCVADVDCPQNMLCEQRVCTRGGGCQMAEIYFDLDEYALRLDSIPTLERNAQCLNRQLPKLTGFKAYLVGHADERGGSRYNTSLSKKRARSVFNTLSRLGVSKRLMEAIGVGEKSPAIPDARTEAQHQRNRRVEFRLRP